MAPRLGTLHAGEWSSGPRSRQECILSTLDERGRLQELPFQPEMLAFCGQRLRVAKVAHGLRQHQENRWPEDALGCPP